MMVKRDPALIVEESKRMANLASKSIHKIEQKPTDSDSVDKKTTPNLKRSVFSNQVIDAKADLKMGNTIDVRL